MEVHLEFLPLSKFPLEVVAYVTLSYEGLTISDVRFVITRNAISLNVYGCFKNMMVSEK